MVFEYGRSEEPATEYFNFMKFGKFLIRCARRPKGIPKGPKKKKKKKIKIDNGHIKTPKFSMLYCSFGYFLLGIKYK